MGRKRRQSEVQKGTQRVIWHLGLYKRLSKEDELKAKGLAQQSDSIKNQDAILNDFISEYFEAGTYEIIAVFEDDGLSGTDENRPDFQRLKQHIRDGKINCVIFKSLARAFRNIADQSKFIEEFCPRHQVRFINTGEPFIDSFMKPRSADSMAVPFTGIMNEGFARQTSLEIRKTFDMKRKKGAFIGAFAPYGLQKDKEDKGKLIIDHEPAQVIKDIFRWFVYEGISKNGIAKKLTQLGIPSPSNYKRQQGFNYRNPNEKFRNAGWSPSSISFMLTNQMYIGNMVQGRHEVISYKVHDCVRVPQEKWYIVEHTHEGIIDIETFQKAQAMMKQDTRTANGKKEVHMFAGFLKCADCKRALHKKTTKNIIYFFCRSYEKGICTKHTIRYDVLEKSVLATIQEQIRLMENVSDTVKTINEVQTISGELDRCNRDLGKAIQELDQVTDVMDNLYLDLKSNLITQPEYIRLKSKLTARQEELQAITTHIADEMQIMKAGIGNNHPYLVRFLEQGNISSLTRGILVELVDTIYVHENGGLTIIFNFTDLFK